MDSWWGIWLLLLVLIVIGAVLFLRATSSSHSRAQDEALEIARRRCARGEIGREEFMQLRGDLQSERLLASCLTDDHQGA